jgi:hypothetical protein
MKNIYYYSDNPTTRKIGDRYGDRLQQLEYAQRYELIGYLGVWLYYVETADHDNEVHWRDVPIDAETDDDVRVILDLCDALAPQEVLNLIAGIASQGAS